MTATTPIRVLFTISILLVCLSSSTCQKHDSVLKGKAKAEAIGSVLEWARLAPFPVGEENLIVTTEGNMFTRTFRVHFQAAAEDISKWVDGSPGLRETTPTSEKGSQHYVIKPGGRANRAEVILSSKGVVTIYASWG
jgi:hypothetical protein